ncbi:hypothetical protein LBMAG48_11750 [Phycisphaerae bacterium]|nr:hypothetical protein LBMAG48_11750 [Phycisphaerae bacterium]
MRHAIQLWSVSLLFAAGVCAQYSNKDVTPAVAKPAAQPAQTQPQTQPAEQPQVVEAPPQTDPSPDAFRPITVGDAAPTLTGAKWIQGEPITKFEEGTIYVVDFWATWCGPCIAFIPELNAIHNDYQSKNVRVIGMSIWENARNSDAGVDFVKRVTDFAKSRRDMNYTIAYGGDDGVISQRWMNAAGRVSIPTVFLIDGKGRVAWFGHPRMGLKDKLDELLAGKLDGATAQAESQAREDLRRRAFKLATPLQKAIESKKWDEAIGYLDEIIELDSQMFAPSAVAKMRLLVTGKQDLQAASDFALNSLEGAFKDDHRTLANMALVMLTQGDAATRNVEAADKLASRAFELAPEQPRVMLAMAEAHWAGGRQDEARAIITKAVGAATTDDRAEIAAAAERMK